MAGILEEVRDIDSAEDLFALLDTAYDPRVLVVHRLQILRIFGVELDGIEGTTPPPNEADRACLYAAALKRAHDLYARSSERLPPAFPGIQRGLVQLGTGRGHCQR